MVRRLLILGIGLFIQSLPGIAQDSHETENTDISETERRIRLLLQIPLEDKQENKTTSSAESEIDPETRQRARDLLAQFRKELSQKSRWIHFKSAKAGLGFLGNVFRSESNPVDSGYLSGSLEGSATLIQKKTPVVNFYAMAERREFTDDVDIPAEDFILLYNNAFLGRNPSSLFTIETTAFYVRQVLEDPLQESGSSLLSLWNFRIRTGITFKAKNQSIFIGHVHYRELYDSLEFDYDSSGLFIKWNWQFMDRWKLKSELEYAPRTYDDRTAREPNGAIIEDSRLRLDRLSVKTGLYWEPPLDWIHTASTSLKLTSEWSEESDYDVNFMVHLANEIEFAIWDLQFGPSVDGSYREYRSRQVSFSDKETQEQIKWSAAFFVRYSYNKSLVFEARYNHDDATSNRESLEYMSEEVEISASYTF